MRVATVGILGLVSLVAFEAMAVATAMPTAVRELDGLAWYGWPFSAYLVASVVGMVLGGDIGDRRGSRTALLTGVGLFAAGLLVVAGQAYEPLLRPRLFGAISAAWVLPALVGPLISGLVTAHLTWRLVFL